MPPFGNHLCLTLPQPEILFSGPLILNSPSSPMVFLRCVYMCLGLHLSAQSPKPEEGTKHTEKEMNECPQLMMHDAGVWGCSELTIAWFVH